MQSGRVRIDFPEIRAPGTLRSRANAVLPVVTIGETASWPADDWHMNLLHPLYEVSADSILVGDLGLFPYPDAVINYATDMFRELSVDIGRNLADRLAHQYLDVGVRRFAPHPGAA